MSKIYLASPYGFSESTRRFLEELKTRLRNAGHDVKDPWELGDKYLAEFRVRAGDPSSQPRIAELQKINRKIAEINSKAIYDSEIVVACLDGPDVDSGTASEIGFAFAHKKRIFGYRGDFRLTGENEAALVNIQVQYWIEKSNGRILRTVPDLLAALTETKQNRRLRKRRVKGSSSEETG